MLMLGAVVLILFYFIFILVQKINVKICFHKFFQGRKFSQISRSLQVFGVIIKLVGRGLRKMANLGDFQGINGIAREARGVKEIRK